MLITLFFLFLAWLSIIFRFNIVKHNRCPEYPGCSEGKKLNSSYSLIKDALTLTLISLIPVLNFIIIPIFYTRLYTLAIKKIHPIVEYGVFGYFKRRNL